MAWKQETSGNEKGNEIVSITGTGDFIEQNHESRKRGKHRQRKRMAGFGTALVSIAACKIAIDSIPGRVFHRADNLAL